MSRKFITYRVRGSHRTEREIRSLLGYDPNIHSGMLPKGNFNLRATEQEYEQIKNAGIRIIVDKRFIEFKRQDKHSTLFGRTEL